MRHTERQRHRQREKQAPCGEPDAGLDPGNLGSGSELKAGAKPLSHPDVPSDSFLLKFLSWRNLSRSSVGIFIVHSDHLSVRSGQFQIWESAVLSVPGNDSSPVL